MRQRQTPPLSSLSAEGLRAYAMGLHDAQLDLYSAWALTGMAETDATSMVITMLARSWADQHTIAEGFADRLEALALPEDLRPTLYWPPGWTAADGAPDIDEAMAYAGAVLLQPAEMCSTEWDGTRWAVCVPIGDGDTDIEWFDTQEEAQAFCNDATTAAQDAIDAAATPQPEAPVVLPPDFGALRRLPEPEAPHAPPIENPPSAGISRAITDLTEAESLDLKQRFEAGVESVSALATAFRIAATSIYSRAKYQKWRRGAGPTAATVLIIPAAHREAPPITSMTTEDKAEARERLRTGATKGARDIVDWFGCTQDEAQDLVDAWRAKGGAA